MNYVILGKSGSGKTEIAKIMTEEFRYDKIVTYTTRPMRDGEVDGIDYYFVSVDEFLKMQENGELVESFLAKNGWFYGTKKDSFNHNDMLIILTPSGLEKLKESNIPVVSFYIEVDDKERYIRQILRGDDIQEIARRSVTDEKDFESISDKVDFVVENNTSDIWDCVRDILNRLSK